MTAARLLFWALFAADILAVLGVIAVIGIASFAYFTLGTLAGSFAASFASWLFVKNPQKTWEAAFAASGVRWLPVIGLPCIILAGAASSLAVDGFVAGMLTGCALVAYWLLFCKPLLFVIDQYRAAFDGIVAGWLAKR